MIIKVTDLDPIPCSDTTRRRSTPRACRVILGDGTGHVRNRGDRQLCAGHQPPGELSIATRHEPNLQIGVPATAQRLKLILDWISVARDDLASSPRCPLLKCAEPSFRRPASSSLLKNFELESFRILAGRCWDEAAELAVIFQPGVWCPDAGRLNGEQFGNADQVIGDQIEQEVDGNASDATMFGLAHGPMLLAPSEDALDHCPA
jgi:hypothetical protein